MGDVLDTSRRLETMAGAGAPPDEAAHVAAVIAVGWGWDARGDLARLALLQEPRDGSVTHTRRPMRRPLSTTIATSIFGTTGLMESGHYEGYLV